MLNWEIAQRLAAGFRYDNLMNPMPLLEGFFRERPVRLYPKNTVIFDAGQEADGLFFIFSGRVKLAVTDERGQERIMYTAGPSDPFPLAAYFLHNDQSASYTAMTNVEAVWRPRQEVDAFLNAHPEANREILRMILLAFYNRIRDLSFSTTERRVVIRLMYLAQRFGMPTDGVIELAITQQELADSVNLTRESISVTLNRLQDEGVVRLQRNKIVVDTERANDLVRRTD
jgi:CRP-like cAMP-binding protein